MKNIYKQATITAIEKETPKIKNFILDISVRAKPGQYVMLWLPRQEEKPFGVVNPSPMTLSIARVGPFTEKIHQLKVGDKITFRGPYGHPYKIKGEKLLMVGGGYGIVPLFFLALTVPENKRNKVLVIIGARTKSDLAFVEKFKDLGCQVEVATDDGSAGYHGYNTDLLKQHLEQERFDSIYTCGPEPMMKKIALIARQKKINCQVSIERYFKCGGIGLCGSCSFHGHLVCKEGPVFDAGIFFEK